MSDDLKLTMHLQLQDPATVFSLVVGGWYPLMFTGSFTHLLDRNIVIWMRNSLAGKRQRSDYEVNSRWLRFLDTPEARINPVLCAMESANRREPSLREFTDEYARSAEVIQRFLPNAQLIGHCAKDFVRLYEVIEALASRHVREIRFLLKTAPLMLDVKSRKQRNLVLRRVIDLAQEMQFGNSILLMAVLSSICEGTREHQKVAARRVLKATANYTAGDAHNALSDIRSLEMLGISSTFGGPTIGFCTRDKMLAAFWVHLKITRVERVNNRSTMHFSLNEKLFPTLSPDEINELAMALKLHGLVKANQSE